MAHKLRAALDKVSRDGVTYLVPDNHWYVCIIYHSNLSLIFFDRSHYVTTFASNFLCMRRCSIIIYNKLIITILCMIFNLYLSSQNFDFYTQHFILQVFVNIYHTLHGTHYHSANII